MFTFGEKPVLCRRDRVVYGLFSHFNKHLIEIDNYFSEGLDKEHTN